MSAPFDLYQEITNQIVATLEAGVIPWRSPILGRTIAGSPKNLTSGKPYRGVNIFLLAITAHLRGYEFSYWLTFKQAAERGVADNVPSSQQAILSARQHASSR